nr:diguanylate cyclase [Natranaerobius trueperi]
MNSLLVVTLDITKQKQVESELKQMKTLLEGKKCYQVYHKRGKPCEPCPSIKCLETGKVEIEEINVQDGHTEGDNLIIEATDVLKNVCRSEDIIARWAVMSLLYYFQIQIEKQQKKLLNG